mgnify:CR=1 FL=1
MGNLREAGQRAILLGRMTLHEELEGWAECLVCWEDMGGRGLQNPKALNQDESPSHTHTETKESFYIMNFLKHYNYPFRSNITQENHGYRYIL